MRPKPVTDPGLHIVSHGPWSRIVLGENILGKQETPEVWDFGISPGGDGLEGM